MSLDIVHISGYGWNTYPDSTTLKRFILTHKDAILDYFSGNDEYDDLKSDIDEISNNEDCNVFSQLAYLNDPNTNCSGACAVISAVINQTHNIGVSYISSGENNDDTILLVRALPWEMSKTERNLTQNELETIMKTYIRELGDDEDTLGDQNFDFY